SRLPPFERRITTPSNTWMRSFSPSTTFTCTLTVSPGRKAGTSLRSCSASIASITLPVLMASSFARSSEPVENDRRRRSDGQMVVIGRSADRLELRVAAVEHVVGEAVSGAEEQEAWRRVGAQARGELAVRPCARTGACRCRDQGGHPTGILLHGGDRLLEVVRHLDQRDRRVARGVVTTSIPTSPVLHDPLGEGPERRSGVRDVEPANAVGPARARDVVDVHVGDRGRDDLAVPVEDRVVQEGHVERGARAHGRSRPAPERPPRGGSSGPCGRSSADSGPATSFLSPAPGSPAPGAAPPPDPARSRRSGRTAAVARRAESRRQRAISAWLPESRTSGTRIPRKTSGRVYCGYSRSPSANDSSASDARFPITPGTSRAIASMTTAAAASPPEST